MNIFVVIVAVIILLLVLYFILEVLLVPKYHTWVEQELRVAIHATETRETLAWSSEFWLLTRATLRHSYIIIVLLVKTSVL